MIQERAVAIGANLRRVRRGVRSKWTISYRKSESQFPARANEDLNKTWFDAPKSRNFAPWTSSHFSSGSFLIPMFVRAARPSVGRHAMNFSTIVELFSVIPDRSARGEGVLPLHPAHSARDQPPFRSAGHWVLNCLVSA